MSAPLLVHALGSADHGGVETMALRLIRHMPRDAFEHAIVFTGHAPGTRESELAATGLPVWRVPYEPGRRAAFVRRARRLFEEHRPARVLSYAFGNHAMVAYAAKRAGVPRVLVRVAASPLHDVRARRKSMLLAHAARPWCDGEIAVSEHVRRELVEGLRLPADRVRLIHNGCEVETLAARARIGRAARSDDRFRVVMVSRMDDAKDQPTLLRAIAIAAREQPHLELGLVGDGPRRAALERLAQDEGIASRTRFLGPRSDVAEIMGASDILVHATHTEGFPNVLIEAMAAHLPIVASDIAPCREVADDAARLVAPRDPRALADVLLDLARHEKAREALALAGDARVREAFPIERTAARYAEVLA